MLCAAYIDWRVLLEIAEVSRAGYYKWRKDREHAHRHGQQEHILKDHIMAIYRFRPYYGYLRITVALRKEGFMSITNAFID
jgi:hypothetical protein